MEVMIMLILLSMVVAGGFLYTFVQLVRSGEYDDMHRPPVQFLKDSEKNKEKTKLPLND